MKTFKKIRKYFVLSQLYVALCILIVPLAASKFGLTKVITKRIEGTKSADESAEETGKRFTVGGADMEEYIKGVVAAEMPASFPEEALKAQAVASRTYAVRAVENADFELGPSDIGQAYVTVDEMKENWGANFDTYYAKICEAVDSTKDEVMVYEGEPILAVFHSTSAGETETAGNIWNYDLPYLESTDSIGDTYAPNYETTTEISCGDIIAKIKNLYPDFQADEAGLFDSIKINERSEAGYITDMTVGNMNFTGKQIREALGIRSANFTVENKGGSIAFTTKGFGHGAGMSQYGAKYMAENGSDYQAILNHYYTGIKIEKL